MWLSLRAISSASSAANSRRICSSALGGTIRSAVEPPLAGTSILASRCPLVATMRMWSGRSSHSTPFRIGRLSSVEAAKATCPTSLCTTPASAFHAPSNLTAGNDGNSSRGSPRSLNFERPHSIATRDSPAAVNRTGPEGSSRAMSTSRSEEHTSELQSLRHLVCRLLLEMSPPAPRPPLSPYTTLFRSHHPRLGLPRAVELDRRERRELLARQPQELELRAAAFDRDARLPRRREPHGPRGQLPRDVHEQIGRAHV